MKNWLKLKVMNQDETLHVIHSYLQFTYQEKEEKWNAILVHISRVNLEENGAKDDTVR